MKMPNQFVIISTQRSGSTLLRTYLDSHPSIQCAGEVFLPKYKKEFSFIGYCRSKGFSPLSMLINRHQIVIEFLDDMFSLKEGAIGFKLMYSQTRWLPYRFPMVMDYFKKNNIRLIHMVRENSIEVLVSRERSKTLGVYHLRRNDINKNLKIRVDVDSVEKELKEIESQKKAWRARLKNYHSLEITYEDFITNREITTKALLDFLGVDKSACLSSPLKKVSPKTLKDSIENFDELKEKIALTEFACLL